MNGAVPRFKELQGQKRVLLVDDDPLILRALKARLTHMGHEVSAFSDGASALCALEAWPADLALVDINMRGLSGLQVAQEIENRHPDCFVVLQTASKAQDVWQQAARQRVFAVLEKPFDARDLLDLIESLPSSHAESE